EPRAWPDYASLLDRRTWKDDLTDEERLALKRESLKGFERMSSLLGRTPEYLTETMKRLRRDIQDIETRLNPAPPPTPAPTAVPTPILPPTQVPSAPG